MGRITIDTDAFLGMFDKRRRFTPVEALVDLYLQQSAGDGSISERAIAKRWGWHRNTVRKFISEHNVPLSVPVSECAIDSYHDDSDIVIDKECTTECTSNDECGLDSGAVYHRVCHEVYQSGELEDAANDTFPDNVDSKSVPPSVPADTINPSPFSPPMVPPLIIPLSLSPSFSPPLPAYNAREDGEDLVLECGKPKVASKAKARAKKPTAESIHDQAVANYKAGAFQFPEHLDTAELREAFTAFLDRREALRSWLTDEAIKRLISRLKPYSCEESIHLLHEATDKNWKGVVFPNTPPPGQVLTARPTNGAGRVNVAGQKKKAQTILEQVDPNWAEQYRIPIIEWSDEDEQRAKADKAGKLR